MLPGRVAREQVRVGRRLREVLPTIGAAVADGRLTAHHAAVLADAANGRVADGLAELQGLLIDLAGGASFDRWRNEVRGIVELLDQDGGHDPADDLARNRLHLADTIDGTTQLSGQFVGEHAVTLRSAMEAKANELFHRFSRDHESCPDIDIPAFPTLQALALVELLREGAAVDLQSTRPPRPEVTLVVRADEPDHGVTDVAGKPLQDGTTRVLRCDADLHAVVVDSLGVPLDLGHHVRLATASQRRFLAARDGGCVFPGCDRPFAWCDIHHVRPHGAGRGRTDLPNLAPLCRRHHGITHRRGWAMHTTADGWHRWTTPAGRTFWSQRHQRRRPEQADSDPDPSRA
jgi:hypothetical protein